MKRSILSFFILFFFFSGLDAQGSVIVYSDCNYRGAQRKLFPGEYRRSDLGIGNDNMSSILILRNMRVILYEDDDFRGAHITLSASDICFNRWNDRVSSMIVEETGSSAYSYSRSNYSSNSGSSDGVVTLYKDCHYRGIRKELTPGNYRVHELGIGNDELSSLRVPRGMEITLYADDRFGGRSMQVTHDIDCLDDQRGNWNDQVSSVVVEDRGGHSYRSNYTNNSNNYSSNYSDNYGYNGPKIRLYKDCEYRGSSREFSPGDYKRSDLGIGNDELSSLRVPRNMEVTLYMDDDFRGRSTVVNSDVPCLSGSWNDQVSSIRVTSRSGGGYRNNNTYTSSYTHHNDYSNNYHHSSGGYNNDQVILYVDADYRGRSKGLNPGRYNSISRAGFPNDALSSVRVPRGYTVILYEHENFGGRSFRLYADQGRLIMNDSASSLEIVRNH